MIKTILLPTDFTIESQELLHCVEQFKNIGLKKIILLHVVDVVHAGGLTPMFEEYDKEKLEECKRYVEEKGLQAETMLKEGNIPKTIVDVAERKNVDCIVIGSTTGGIIESLLLGSTTEYVVRKSKKMVLVEKYAYLKKYDYKTCEKLCATGFDRILIPIDFSKECMRAVEKIKALNGSGKQIILVHVIQKAKSYKELKKLKPEALKKLKALGKKLKGFKLKYYVVAGVPSEEIKKLAVEKDITLIALTNRGGGLIKDILLGSTAENLLRKTSHPVLLIPVGGK